MLITCALLEQINDDDDDDFYTKNLSKIVCLKDRPMTIKLLFKKHMEQSMLYSH